MSKWTNELDARTAAWIHPVPGPSASGTDVRYDPAFEALSRELAKLDAPQATPVDWVQVERDATEILSAKSKDLLVASWLSAALHERAGLDGLATGLWGLGSTVEQFWDGLFPPLKRIKGRTSAVTWLVERTVLRLETNPGPLDHDAIDRLYEAVKRLQRVLPERFGEHAPGTRPLGDAVERLRLSLPPRPADAAPAAPAAVATAAAPAAVPPAAAAPTAAAPAAVAPPPAAAPPAAPAAAAPAAPSEPSHADVLEARVRALLQPIAGASPTGADGRYEPEHESMRREIEKLDAPTGGAVAWPELAQQSATFLERKSKDVLIASYYAWAKYELEGLDGLATGLALLGGLVGGMWEGLYPTRVKARANAIGWLIQRADVAIGAPTPPKGSTDRVVVERLAVAARTFVSVVRDKFADEAPGVRPLLDGIERLKMSLPAPAPVAPPPVAAPAAPPPAPVAAPAAAAPAAAPAAAALPAAPAATLAAGADPTAFLQQVATSLTQAASTLRTADATDANAYRMRRVGLYLAVLAPPPVASAPKTAARAPAANLRQQLTVLHNNAKWGALLEEAESALTANRFWLDLHRYVFLALEGLGHHAARDAVGIECAHLMRRFPTLAELAFVDGTPFASPDTVQWLASLGGGPATAGAGGSAADEDDPIEATLREARSLASGGKRDDAMRALGAAIRTAPDERARFRLRLATARICGTGAVPAARALYEGLVTDIDAMRLDLWDPALATEALRGYLELLRDSAKGDAAKGGGRVAEETADVYRRLCRIDPLAAVGTS